MQLYVSANIVRGHGLKLSSSISTRTSFGPRSQSMINRTQIHLQLHFPQHISSPPYPSQQSFQLSTNPTSNRQLSPPPSHPSIVQSPHKTPHTPVTHKTQLF